MKNKDYVSAYVKVIMFNAHLVALRSDVRQVIWGSPNSLKERLYVEKRQRRLKRSIQKSKRLMRQLGYVL